MTWQHWLPQPRMCCHQQAPVPAATCQRNFIWKVTVQTAIITPISVLVTLSADDFDAQELFNMFFGGGFGGMHTRGFRTQFGGPPRRGAPAQNDQRSNSFFGLVQLLPIFFLLFVSFFNSSSEPPFRTAPEGSFRHRMDTSRLAVPFYVKSKVEFEQNYPQFSMNRRKLEGQVENDYIERVRAQCHQEKMTRQRLRTWGRQEAADGFAMPACDQWAEIHSKYNLGYTVGAY